jgi:hypothetical protein
MCDNSLKSRDFLSVTFCTLGTRTPVMAAGQAGSPSASHRDLPEWMLRHQAKCRPPYFNTPRDIPVEGQAKVYARKGASGFDLRCRFCAERGTGVMFDSDRMPGFCNIAVGCFCRSGFLHPPTFGVWEESMHSWFVVPTISQHHSQGLVAAPAISQ